MNPSKSGLLSLSSSFSSSSSSFESCSASRSRNSIFSLCSPFNYTSCFAAFVQKKRIELKQKKTMQPSGEVKSQPITYVELKDILPWKPFVESHAVVVFYNPDCPYSMRALVVLKELVNNHCLTDVTLVKVVDWNFVHRDLYQYKGLSTLPQIFTKHKEKGIIVTDSTRLIDAFMGNETNCSVKTVLFGA